MSGITITGYCVKCRQWATPAYQVGDWIRTEDGDFCVKKVPPLPDYGDWNKVIYRYRGKPIIKKLSPSEVVIQIGCLSGTVAELFPGCDWAFRLIHGDDKESSNSIIKFSALDATTRELVESLLKAQEEE